MDLQAMLADTSIFTALDHVSWDEGFSARKACGHFFDVGRIGTVLCIADEGAEVMVKRFPTAEEASATYHAILLTCMGSDGIIEIAASSPLPLPEPPVPPAPHGWDVV